MKKLNGINKGFSLFENNEMKNLQSIVGGSGTQQSIQSNCPSSPEAVECDKYSDTGKWLCRVEVGPAIMG